MARRAQHLRCSLCEGSERADNKLDNTIIGGCEKYLSTALARRRLKSISLQPQLCSLRATGVRVSLESVSGVTSLRCSCYHLTGDARLEFLRNSNIAMSARASKLSI